MAFHVGQKVVCVDSASGHHPGRSWWTGCKPKVGATYTVRGLAASVIDNAPCLLLEEIRNKVRVGATTHKDAGYAAWRFRPVQTRTTETGMAILRKVADDASKRKNLVVTGD